MKRHKKDWSSKELKATSIVTGFLVATIAPLAAVAQDWRIEPTVLAAYDYNDNIRLNDDSQSQGQDTDASGVAVELGADISRRAPTSLVRLRPWIRSTHYGTDADSEDFFLDTLFRNTTPKSEWSFEARFQDEEVLSAEIADPDFDDPDIDRPINDDSGLVTQENRRQRFVVTPRAAFRLTERVTLGLSAGLIDTEYDNTQAFSGFQNSFADISLSRRVSEKDTVRLLLFGRRFEPDLAGIESDSYGATLTYDRQITERYSTFVRAGYESIDTTSVVGGQSVDSSDGALLFGAGLRRQFEVSRLVLDAQRSVGPSGIAELLERNLVRARFIRDLSELTELRITARYQDTSSTADNSLLSDRQFARVELDVDRRLTRAFSVIAGYAYTRQEFDGAGSEESSNAVYVGFSYNPGRR